MRKVLLVGLYKENESMDDFYKFLDSIHSFAIPIIEGEEIENSKFIYIETPLFPSSSTSETPLSLQKNKYDRFDKQLIENIESNELNIYFFYCYDIDERFTNTKYYNIETKKYEWRNKQIINETLTIKYDDIVDDLYYKRYIYESEYTA